MSKFTDKLEPNIVIGTIFTILFALLYAVGIGGDRFLDLTVWSATFTLGKGIWEVKKNISGKD